jgi:hypothetical protein
VLDPRALGLVPSGGQCHLPGSQLGVPADLPLARPDFGELFLGRSARTPQPAAPGRHLPKATTGPAVIAAGVHQAGQMRG